MTSNPSTHRQIKADYLSGHEALRPFYSYPLTDPDFAAIMADKKFFQEKRKLLHASLLEQYEGYELPDLLRDNIDALLNDNSYTLTTGHQLGLMGGPLFTVYKVLSIIRLSEKLNQKFPQKRVIPVFWIHTEDHDFEEINHFYEDFGRKHTYRGDFASATGLHRLEPEIRSLIPDNFGENLRQAWQEGASMAQAYRQFFHELMGKYGLVILDAAQPSLKAIFSPIFEKEVFHQISFRAVQEQSESLEAAGYKLQVHPREINLFYLDEKGRNRIEEAEGGFRVLDRDMFWEKEEMRKLLWERPEQFSPNVSLRPLYQESILPNLAYIGGWGELSYWMQLKGVFEAVGENFPLLLPRFSATLFPELLWQEWRDLGLEAEDIRKSRAEIFKEYTPRLWDGSSFLARQEEILDSIVELKHYIHGEISKTLSRSAEALEVKTRHFIENLHKKADRVIRHKHSKVFDRIHEIKAEVNPDQAVQERVWSLAALHGSPDEFVEWLKPQCDPLLLEHKILILPQNLRKSGEALSREEAGK